LLDHNNVSFCLHLWWIWYADHFRMRIPLLWSYWLCAFYWIFSLHWRKGKDCGARISHESLHTIEWMRWRWADSTVRKRQGLHLVQLLLPTILRSRQRNSRQDKKEKTRSISGPEEIGPPLWLSGKRDNMTTSPSLEACQLDRQIWSKTLLGRHILGHWDLLASSIWEAMHQCQRQSYQQQNWNFATCIGSSEMLGRRILRENLAGLCDKRTWKDCGIQELIRARTPLSYFPSVSQLAVTP
jgi:hypothetical protein